MSLASFAFGTRLVFCTSATAFLYPFLEYRKDGKRHQQIDIYYRDIGILNFITGEKLEATFERHIDEISSKRKTVSPEGNTA